MPPRGKLIAFEGLDRAGKSTQVARLATTLRAQGHSVRQLRFPDRSTPIGQLIDAYLRGERELNDRVAHLLFSANRWELVDTILAALAAGETVILDRYYYSGLVYTLAKTTKDTTTSPTPTAPTPPAITPAWALSPDTALPRPDLVLFLSISAAAAAERANYGAERFEEHGMQARVRALFGALMRAGPEGADFVEVDAAGGEEEVAERGRWRGCWRSGSGGRACECWALWR
ncbi:uncharacterized protein K452DRAFT_58813 [Aplosporella prunicola CBS 121167]|uniref:dTMP kinase n=1 Tax=Aplosporella prunicola CBS 121167 TaxID=1176127 RepID=A0A6A6B9R5_9PEZI|nr:uncharacterized protein K452DRAFT_58813 [Aplosporella prunicola CBS 121167]KAF2139974.1 hypothetical protein K452DRAFT_58813 [Aplosporella prunicola CBS 121167]